MGVKPILAENGLVIYHNTCRMDYDIECEFIFYPFSREFNCLVFRNDEQLVRFTGNVDYDGSESIGRDLPSKLVISDIERSPDNITDKDLDRVFRLFLLWVHCLANNYVCIVCISDYYACMFSDFVFTFYGPGKQGTQADKYTSYTFRLSGNKDTDMEVAKAMALMFVKDKEVSDSMMEYMLRYVPKSDNL